MVTSLVHKTLYSRIQEQEEGRRSQNFLLYDFYVNFIPCLIAYCYTWEYWIRVWEKTTIYKLLKKRETSRWNSSTTRVERSKFTFYRYLVSDLMFPTVLDVNNIHCFILVRSIGIISFYVKIATWNTDKSLLSVILWLFSVVLSDYLFDSVAWRKLYQDLQD